MTLSNLAISARSDELRYFFTSNCFSNSKICLPVKVVRAFFFFLSAAAAAASASSGNESIVDATDGGLVELVVVITSNDLTDDDDVVVDSFVTVVTLKLDVVVTAVLVNVVLVEFVESFRFLLLLVLLLDLLLVSEKEIFVLFLFVN